MYHGVTGNSSCFFIMIISAICFVVKWSFRGWFGKKIIESALTEANRKDRKQCFRCAEWIQQEAKVCRFCGYQYETFATQRRVERQHRKESISTSSSAHLQVTEENKLSLGQAAKAIGVTSWVLQDYIKSGRLRTNPDGTIDPGELLRAGFITQK